jgi:hypothetical protein
LNAKLVLPPAREDKRGFVGRRASPTPGLRTTDDDLRPRL